MLIKKLITTHTPSPRSYVHITTIIIFYVFFFYVFNFTINFKINTHTHINDTELWFKPKKKVRHWNISKWLWRKPKISMRLTSFLDFNSSELKLLSNRAKNKFKTIKLPITKVGRKIAKQEEAPCWMDGWHKSFNINVKNAFYNQHFTSSSALIQSHKGSIHSPHKIRKIIINEWKKSLKFHLQS